MKPQNTFCGQTRRDFLHTVGGAFPSLALTGMLANDSLANPLALAYMNDDAFSPILPPPLLLYF